MKTSYAVKALVLAIVAAGLTAGGYFAGLQRAEKAVPPVATTGQGEKVDPKTGRKVLYWQDPMVPGQRFDRPGKSPYMDMELVPVYADEAGSEGGVKVNPSVKQNLGIRFATVRRESISDSIEVVGTTQFDESRAEVVQTRVTSYLEKLYARAPMQRVKRGEAIATLFVPEWIAPQEEYLSLRRSGNSELSSAARQRMRALSIPNKLAEQMERTGQVQRYLTLTSPVDGVITELGVREGATVTPGMTVAKIAGLQTVWLLAEVPEALAAAVRPGMAVEAVGPGDPKRKYSGKVREILPGVSTATRTLQARLQLDNKDGSLTPGLLMRVRLAGDKPASRLLVPSEAIINTGKRSVVLVAGDDDSMLPAEVTTGRDIGDSTEILSGLSEGQKIVVSGQFLIDSEANLRSVLPKLTAQGSSTETRPAETKRAAPAPTGHEAHGEPVPRVYRGVGKVEHVSPEGITFSHQPIPELQWPAMTMEFAKRNAHAFHDIEPGQEAEFTFKKSDDGYTLETVKPVGGVKK